MQTTILIFHPQLNKSRVNRKLKEEIEKYSSINVHDEYAKYPDGNIDVLAEQQILEQSDRIIIQFPFYWYSSPSLLKKWEDMVLTHGWAYGSGGSALAGKELLLVISTGASSDNYHIYGQFHYTIDEMLIPFKATSNLIGTKFIKPFIIQGVLQSLSDKQLNQKAKEYVTYILE